MSTDIKAARCHTGQTCQHEWWTGMMTMSLGGADGGEGLLIGPILEWWDRHTAKRDARRTARAEARRSRRESHKAAAPPERND